MDIYCLMKVGQFMQNHKYFRINYVYSGKLFTPIRPKFIFVSYICNLNKQILTGFPAGTDFYGLIFFIQSRE